MITLQRSHYLCQNACLGACVVLFRWWIWEVAGVVNVRNVRVTFTTLGLVANILAFHSLFQVAVVVASAAALLIIFSHGAISVRSSVIVFVRSMPAIKSASRQNVYTERKTKMTSQKEASALSTFIGLRKSSSQLVKAVWMGIFLLNRAISSSRDSCLLPTRFQAAADKISNQDPINAWNCDRIAPPDALINCRHLNQLKEYTFTTLNAHLTRGCKSSGD